METGFAERIRARFPEGLTGVFAVGGTRTSYLLTKGRDAETPGKIDDFAAYANYGYERLYELLSAFLEFGGQNMIVAMFSYQGFYERGDAYAEQSARMCLRTIEDDHLAFYRAHDIDPYFAGIDTLLHLPEDHYARRMAEQFAQFQREWPYQEGRRKLIWEVAPIPLFSFLNVPNVMGQEAHAELQARLNQSTDLREMHALLYEYYARAVYGTDLPVPHFYLGTNRNGDMKLRAVLPIALLCGDPFRLYYTPYPSLFVTRETLQAILEDLAFGKRLRSEKVDYQGKVTRELLQAEYERVIALSADPASTFGLVRGVGTDNGS